ncbi:PST family transport protein [Pantoea sp. ICBG 1758]|jgi:lipopolysaccharide exporter|nr:oligosaccharide flippase family protein [Pantoea sp. Acro-807]NIE72651.1 oligosaccharide flippase family protein [Pantoea sp. Acro-807]PPC61368.1 PST family transport protein [Pantoea sp. ICBG 1758]
MYHNEHTVAIRERELSSAKWSLLSSAKIIGIGVLQLTLLAQTLQANELNLLVIAILALLVIDTLADRGFNNKIIRKISFNNSEMSVLYWGSIFTGLFIFAALFIGSDIYSAIAQQPHLAVMLEMMSVIFIIIPQGQHYRAILQREKQFTRIAFIEITSVAAGLAATLFTVWLMPSALCAVWGYLALVSVRMLLCCYYGRAWFQPAYRFSLKEFASVRARNG